MGDVDGRRGAAERTVTVRATRQLTDRPTHVGKNRWGWGHRLCAWAPPAAGTAELSVGNCRWTPFNLTRAPRGFLKPLGTTQRTVRAADKS